MRAHQVAPWSGGRRWPGTGGKRRPVDRSVPAASASAPTRGGRL